MNDTDERTDRTRLPRRSRRLFMQSAGVAGLGLAAGVTAVASQEDEAGDEADTTTETDESTDAGEEDDPGRTPIDSPTTIEEPGEYELVADIAPETLDRQHCIAVDLGETDGEVTIYGNGHTIDMSAIEGGDCLALNPANHGAEGEGPGWFANVEDVTVTGGEAGISGLRDTSGRFTDITAVDNRTGVDFSMTGGVLTNCILAHNDAGARLYGTDISGGSDATFDRCTILGNGVGVSVTFGSASVSACRVVGNSTGISVNYKDAGAGISESHICGNEAYGVEAESGTDDVTGEGDFEGGASATNNYWGAADGPSSYGDPEEPYADPETGEPANGSGDAVTEGLEPGVSNVRFDPYHETTLADVGADR